MIDINHNTVYKYTGGGEYAIGWIVGFHVDDGATAFMELMDEYGDLSGKFEMVDIGMIVPASEQEIKDWTASLI